MDEGLSRAVRKVFVDLYRAGLIYKDKRLVNWDPKLLTAISDLEVEQIEVKGHLWHLRYPLEGRAFDPDDASTYIVVATTRPETMLGDTAVAVHPDDERYKASRRQACDPAAGRPPHPDRRRRIFRPREGLGRGEDHAGARFQRLRGRPAPRAAADQHPRALKPSCCSTAIRTSSKVSARVRNSTQTIQELHGLDRFAARKKIVERLEESGLVEKIEPYVHTVPHGDRSNVVIEPFLTDQWYVDAKTLWRSRPSRR